MAAIAFDTLKFARRLKDVGVPKAQAEAQAELMAEERTMGSGLNGTYLRPLAPEKPSPVGSNSFDRGYSANSQWSNEFDPTGEGFSGARGLK